MTLEEAKAALAKGKRMIWHTITTDDAPRPQCSHLVTRFTSMRPTFTPPDHQKNCPIADSGPFLIEKCIGTHAYHLTLPAS